MKKLGVQPPPIASIFVNLNWFVIFAGRNGPKGRPQIFPGGYIKMNPKITLVLSGKSRVTRALDLARLPSEFASLLNRTVITEL